MLPCNSNVTNCNKEIEKENIKGKKYEKIIEIYNSQCVNLPKAQKVTDKRKKAINNFLKEFTEDQFKNICIIANNSDFLIGKNNNGWKADFDFLMRVDKATNVLEGKYNKTKTDKMDGFIELWKEAKNEEERNNTDNKFASW